MASSNPPLGLGILNLILLLSMPESHLTPFPFFSFHNFPSSSPLLSSLQSLWSIYGFTYGVSYAPITSPHSDAHLPDLQAPAASPPPHSYPQP